MMSSIGIEMNEYRKLCEMVTKVKSTLKDNSFSESQKLKIIKECIDVLEENLY